MRLLLRDYLKWVKGSAVASNSQGEWSEGQMTQFVVRFCDGPKVVRERTVKFQRALPPAWPQELHFYVKAPAENFDHIKVQFLHFGQATVTFDNAQLAAFDD